jgi:O-Antigen ligase
MTTSVEALRAPRAQIAAIPRPGRSARKWSMVTLLLILGYLSMTRSFAYFGLPSLGVPVPIYIGEMVFIAFIFLKGDVGVGRWLGSLVERTPISGVSWAIYLFFLFGVFEVLRGVFLDGHDAIIALQNFVFNYYALFFFLGLWIGQRDPDLLRRSIRLLAWINGIYGVAWLLVLSRLPVNVPGSGVQLFGQPAGTYIAILGLLAFERDLKKVRVPLLLCAFVLLALQIRAGWAAFLFGIATWALVTRKFGRLMAGLAAVGLLLAVSLVFDLKLPANERQNRGEISARNIAGAAIAPFDRDLASQLSDQADRHAGTTEWRRDWWGAIWRSVHEDPVRTIIGHGYGFTIADLVPFLEGRWDLRTPHNFFFYAIGYGGWLGTGLFFWLLFAICRLMWRSYKLTGNPFGLVFVGTALGVASFGDFFETPFGAIPFFLVVGLAAAPAVIHLEDQVLDEHASPTEA